MGKQQPETPAPPKTTMQDHVRDLEAWLIARNLTLAVVARGKKTGQIYSAADWEPDTHIFTVIPIERTNNGTVA